jgi:hypothetical protein
MQTARRRVSAAIATWPVVVAQIVSKVNDFFYNSHYHNRNNCNNGYPLNQIIHHRYGNDIVFGSYAFLAVVLNFFFISAANFAGVSVSAKSVKGRRSVHPSRNFEHP